MIKDIINKITGKNEPLEMGDRLTLISDTRFDIYDRNLKKIDTVTLKRGTAFEVQMVTANDAVLKIITGPYRNKHIIIDLVDIDYDFHRI